MLFQDGPLMEAVRGNAFNLALGLSLELIYSISGTVWQATGRFCLEQTAASVRRSFRVGMTAAFHPWVRRYREHAGVT